MAIYGISASIGPGGIEIGRGGWRGYLFFGLQLDQVELKFPVQVGKDMLLLELQLDQVELKSVAEQPAPAPVAGFNWTRWN